LRTEICICAHIPRVETKTRILLIRHAIERRKASNTARLAALALPSCALVEYGLGGGAFHDPRLLEEGTVLLFPGSATMTRADPPPAQLVVLDGSWNQARRMSQRIEALRNLPRLSLPAKASPPRRLRAETRAEGMATLEAIARALALLEGEAVAAPLDALHEELVRRSLSLRERIA
jgi:DTW domain-containing protein YfiP